MMEYWEVIYETGSKSVISVDNRDAALGGLREHHRRAKEGQVGGPTGHPAERIKGVLVYPEHPGDFGADQTAHVDEMRARLESALKELPDRNGVVSVPALVERVIQDASALKYRDDEGTGRHDSQYRAPEVETLDPSLWGGDS